MREFRNGSALRVKAAEARDTPSTIPAVIALAVIAGAFVGAAFALEWLLSIAHHIRLPSFLP